VVTNHISGTADHIRCCQLRWTVTVVNWWPSSVTSLSHWPSTSVYSTVSVRYCVALVCQRQPRKYRRPLQMIGSLGLPVHV